MKMPPLPPLTPTVEYTMEEIEALILAYGNAVREECAKVCEQLAEFVEWNETGITAGFDPEECAEAIRKDDHSPTE